MSLLERVESSQWFAVCSDGHLKCSCGRPLIKLENGKYKCSYGYPEFDIDEGEVRIDKFGNIWLKKKDHEDKNTKQVIRRKKEE